MKGCSAGLVGSIFLCSNCFHRLDSVGQLTGMSSIRHLDLMMLMLAAAGVFSVALSEWSRIPFRRELCQLRGILPELSLEHEPR